MTWINGDTDAKAPILLQIWDMLKNCTHTRLSHVLREGNEASDWLAKWAYRFLWPRSGGMVSL
jgi:hypothetical protein